MNTMTNKFRANGKLLLTGEYLVMKGASALVLPLKHGQTLLVKRTDKPGTINWKAFEKGNEWFTARFDLPSLRITATDDHIIAERLRLLIGVVREMNPLVFEVDHGFQFETRLEFPRNYGWGSSSTLYFLLGQWAGIDAMALHRKLSQGSGYDVAAAGRDTPFYFRLEGENALMEDSRYRHPFRQEVFFVFLGHKQNSETAVREYLRHAQAPNNLVKKISDIGRELSECTELDHFEDLVTEHEERMGHHLGKPTLKNARFADYPGAIKSLGAWGGDFALFVSRKGKEFLHEYLAGKDIKEVFEIADLFTLKQTMNADTSAI